MKQLIKYLCCLSLLFTLGFTLVGCTNDSNDNNDDNKDNSTSDTTGDDTTNDDFDDIDSRVESSFNGNYQTNRSDIVEAVSYINNNLDKVKDKEVAKKLYEKGCFLEVAANQADVSEDNTIRNLGIKAKNYAKRVHDAKDDEVDGVIDDARDDFDEFSAKLGDGIDNAVDDFMDFFENKTTE